MRLNRQTNERRLQDSKSKQQRDSRVPDCFQGWDTVNSIAALDVAEI